jgi:hypothetical protein
MGADPAAAPVTPSEYIHLHYLEFLCQHARRVEAAPRVCLVGKPKTKGLPLYQYPIANGGVSPALHSRPGSALWQIGGNRCREDE